MHAMQLRELTEVQALYGDVLCRPSVELEKDGTARMVVEFATTTQPLADGSTALDLYYDLRRACAIANLRLLAMELGIEPARLERALEGA